MQRHCLLPTLIVLVLLAGATAFAQGPAGLPDSVLSEVRVPEQVPKGKYAPVKTWEAETAAHITGRVVDDPEAEGGKALEAKPTVDEPGTLLYGPYMEVAPGDYVAFFRVKLLETPDDDIPGRLDACVSGAQDIRAARDLVSADLVVGKYAEVPLGFHYDHGKLECRLTWYGTVGLRVDRVSLFRIEGADTSLGGWRAPAAVPSGLPKDLTYRAEPRPFPDLFPRSAAPAKELVVCDLRKERADVRLLIYSLQGLVNRTQPRLYCLSIATDPLWLEQMQQRGWVEKTQKAEKPLDLIERFRDCVKGMVIPDPALPASRNVATMIASVKDGLVVSPRLSKQLALPVLDDLHGRWRTSAEAYRWAFDNLWPSLNHHVIACLWPDHLALRDYLVENKVFIFWISGPLDGARKYASPTDEYRLMEELLARMPANIPVLGYSWAGQDVGVGEGPGVSLLAEFGKYLVGSIDCANLSVHSGITIPDLRQHPAPPAPTLQRDRAYVSFIISDGDNLPVLTAGNFPQLWQEKVRGQFPIGWTLSPSAIMLVPDVVDYYYRTATPGDQFLGAVSGVGYTYPDLYGKRFREADRRKVYEEFLDQTATYMQRSDEKQLWIMGATRPEVISRYAERIRFLDALFPDYGRRVLTPEEATYPTARGVPVFHAVTGWQMEATREQRIAQLAEDTRRLTPAQRPAFLHLFVLNWFTDLALLQEALQKLGPEYVAVRPDHLAELWRQEMAQQEVLVRLVASAAAIEGQSLTLEGSIRNMTERPLSVALRVTEGLEAATVTPGQADLKPGQGRTVIVAGRPTADRVVLEASGPFGSRRAEVALHRVRLSELFDPLPASATLLPAGYLEAEAMAHRSGSAVGDPDAGGKSAWLARKGETQPGYVIFGPYTPLDAGKHLALFRLKRTDEGAGVLALLDACVGGGTPQTGKRELRAEELPPGRFRWVALPFDHPGGPHETRIEWTGAASLEVDSIGVWRVQGR